MERYLISQDAVTIMNKLRQKTFASPKEALSIIEKLKEAARYKTDKDYAFALKVQEIAALSFMGRHDEFKDSISEVYEGLSKLTDLDVYLEACGRLGPVYDDLGDMKKCIYLFSSIYEQEKKHEILSMRSATACANLALLYKKYGRADESKFYYNKEAEILGEYVSLEDLSSYDELTYIFLCANIAKHTAEQGDAEACKNNLEKISRIMNENTYESVILEYKEAYLYYYVLMKNEKGFKKGIEEFLELVYAKLEYARAENFLIEIYRMIEEDERFKMILIPHIREFLDLIGENCLYNNLYSLYSVLIDYAINNNDDDLLFLAYKNFKKVSVKLEKEVYKNKSEAIDFFVSIAEKKLDEQKAAAKNEYISEIINEEKAKARELKHIYDQLRIITTLGQKITAASDIYEIARIIYDELNSFMDIDLAAIFSNVSDGKFMNSYVYLDDKLERDIDLKIDDKSSLCARVYSMKKPIITNYLHQNDYYIDAQNYGIDKRKLGKSAIYFPIVKDKDVLGVITIQSKKEGAYEPKHISVIRSVVPYIAISINNSMNAERLERELVEIEKDKKVLRKLVEYNRELNYIDPLTKVYSRQYLNNNFDFMLSEAEDKDECVSVFMFDIDDFKKYNDINGHLEGDKALIAVATKASTFFASEGSLLARFGGEEFVGINVNMGMDEAKEKAERILDAIRDLGIKYEKSSSRCLTVSIGLVSFKAGVRLLPNEIMKCVDDNLYEAKRSGKNCIITSVIGEGYE